MNTLSKRVKFSKKHSFFERTSEGLGKIVGILWMRKINENQVGRIITIVSKMT